MPELPKIVQNDFILSISPRGGHPSPPTERRVKIEEKSEKLEKIERVEEDLKKDEEKSEDRRKELNSSDDKKKVDKKERKKELEREKSQKKEDKKEKRERRKSDIATFLRSSNGDKKEVPPSPKTPKAKRDSRDEDSHVIVTEPPRAVFVRQNSKEKKKNKLSQKATKVKLFPSFNSLFLRFNLLEHLFF